MPLDADLAPYLDLLTLPRPALACHARMPRLQRAAQFAPFRALDGLEDASALAARREAPEDIR